MNNRYAFLLQLNMVIKHAEQFLDGNDSQRAGICGVTRWHDTCPIWEGFRNTEKGSQRHGKQTSEFPDRFSSIDAKALKNSQLACCEMPCMRAVSITTRVRKLWILHLQFEFIAVADQFGRLHAFDGGR